MYPSEAYVMLDGKQSKAIADQLITVSKLSAADLQKVDQAIRTQLDL